MTSERCRTWAVPSMLAAATCLVVACGGSNSSSGGQEHGVDGAADVGMLDASPSDADDAGG